MLASNVAFSQRAFSTPVRSRSPDLPVAFGANVCGDFAHI